MKGYIVKVAKIATHVSGALASSSRAAVRNRLLSFQRRPNPRPLLSAQRRELKTINRRRKSSFLANVIAGPKSG
jgi:hypothetical protein